MTKLELFMMTGILILSIYPIHVLAIDNLNNSNNSDNYTMYRTFADSYKGLYNVINMNTKTYVPYDNRILNINVGDTIEWINDDDMIGLTIISNEKLWKDKSGYLKSTRKRFNYTFKKPGNYTFHIRQIAGIQPQIVIVKSTNAVNSTKSSKSKVATKQKNSTIDTSRRTIVRIANSSEIFENSGSNESIWDNGSNVNNGSVEPPNRLEGISKFSNEIFLSIMIICAVYIKMRFKKNV